MHCADASNCLHRDYCLRNHRHINCNAVAWLNAEVDKCVCGLLNLTGQFGIGDFFSVTRFTFEEDCGALAIAGLNVAVEAVIRDVELAIGKPLGERRVAPVEGLGEWLVPMKLAGLISPKAKAVGLGFFIK